MEFKIGKHKTRDGKDAVVLLDWREHGVKNGYPLEGYIVREDGIKYVDNWTPDGRNDIDRGSHHDDLMPPAPRRAERIIYLRDDVDVKKLENAVALMTFTFNWAMEPYKEFTKKYRVTIEEVQE